jgi:hypothetical protein
VLLSRSFTHFSCFLLAIDQVLLYVSCGQLFFGLSLADDFGCTLEAITMVPLSDLVDPLLLLHEAYRAHFMAWRGGSGRSFLRGRVVEGAVRLSAGVRLHRQEYIICARIHILLVLVLVCQVLRDAKEVLLATVRMVLIVQGSNLCVFKGRLELV